MHLDIDRTSLDAFKSHRRYARHHVQPPAWSPLLRGTFAEHWLERKGAP
jgi:hypothetical protein